VIRWPLANNFPLTEAPLRDFWRGTQGMLPDLATRITGSSDLIGHSGRRPTASVSIATLQDGFTIADLVSYNGKHHEANGEDNHDHRRPRRAPAPNVIVFRFRTGAPGQYIWKCYDPCGSGLAGDGIGGQNNFGGAMATTGYMAGTLTVT